MKEIAGWSWRSSQRQPQQAHNNPVLTWASLQFLAPGSKPRRRGGENEAPSASKSRPRFAPPTAASSSQDHSRIEIEAGLPSANNIKDDIVVQRRLEPIHSYLMLSTADGDGDVNTRTFDDHLGPNCNPYTIGNVSIQKSSPHSSNYQVQCMGEKFTGFHRILFHDTSFYKAEVSPLASEFVNKKRNICVIVHGAHGTGRRRVLFGHEQQPEVLDHTNISKSINELCANPYRQQTVSDDYHDSVSSIGSKGVSEVQNINSKTKAALLLHQNVQVIPQEVSFSVGSSSSIDGKRDPSDNNSSPSRNDALNNAGIIPQLMEDIYKRLCRQYPQSSFCSGGKGGQDTPVTIPVDQSSSRCLLAPNRKIVSNAAKKNMKRSNSIDTSETANAYISSQEIDDLIGVRVSCFEIVDDLASGETTTHDLLSECMQTEEWPIERIPSHPQQRRLYNRSMSFKSSISWGDIDHNSDKDDSVDLGKDKEKSSIPSLSNSITHDHATGIVFVEGSVEMRCFSQRAILECLKKAEEVRRKRKNGDDVVFGKLSHTVYLLSVEHHDQSSNGGIALTQQFVISTVDETMSNSASLALHSSCSVLNSVTRQLANYVATPPPCRNPLTQLLRGCIGGDCRTLALGVADPTNDDMTLPTLRFGEAISWVYNYWTGEDVSDSDSDESPVTDNKANFDISDVSLSSVFNESCNEKSTPSTEQSSYQPMNPQQTNLVAATTKNDTKDDNPCTSDAPQEIPSKLPTNTTQIKVDRGLDLRDDPSWHATLTQIDKDLDLVRSKMKSKLSQESIDSETAKTESKLLDVTHSVDNPSSSCDRVETKKTKDQEIDEMRAQIEALRQERDDLEKSKNESELELEKAREDIFLLKGRRREDTSHINSKEIQNPPHAPTPDESIVEPIKVCFRLRPKNKLESYRRSAMHIDASENSPNVCINSSLYGAHSFCFDKVFGEDSTQQTVSDFFTAQFTSKLLNGVNCALLLAGAKSSGKSHSLFGEIPAVTPAEKCSLTTKDAGILPNIVCDLYHQMRSSSSAVSYSVKCSFVAIHLERIIDLLRPLPNDAETIFARYSSEGLRLDGATESFCSEEEDVFDVIRRGLSFQNILSDIVGSENDLFHTCFLLKVEASTGKRATLILSEILSFGATKSYNASFNAAATLHQRSSTALNRVVRSLTQDVPAEVPYQSSKVTSILQDALGGNCYTSLMITASPCKTSFVETLNAIKLGQRLRTVHNTSYSNPNATADILNVDDKLRSIILDGQSKMALLKQQYDKLLREKQAAEDALTEERQQLKIIAVEKEQTNLEVKRLKIREKRATEFIKCLRGLILHVEKNSTDDSKKLAIDQVIKMIGSDIDLGDLVDIDILLKDEGFISKDEATPSPDDLFHKLLGSEGSDLSPTDVISAGVTGEGNGIRNLRRDMRKVAKANVELQVSLKKEKDFVQSIKTDKLYEEALLMRTSRDKMTNCALTAVNKLNEVSTTCSSQKACGLLLIVPVPNSISFPLL